MICLLRCSETSIIDLSFLPPSHSNLTLFLGVFLDVFLDVVQMSSSSLLSFFPSLANRSLRTCTRARQSEGNVQTNTRESSAHITWRDLGEMSSSRPSRSRCRRAHQSKQITHPQRGITHHTLPGGKKWRISRLREPSERPRVVTSRSRKAANSALPFLASPSRSCTPT